MTTTDTPVNNGVNVQALLDAEPPSSTPRRPPSSPGRHQPNGWVAPTVIPR